MTHKLNEKADRIMKKVKGSKFEQIAPINDEIDLLRNGIHLIIGGRGSGKTYYTCRELVKLSLIPKKEQTYTNVYYISDNNDDATWNRYAPIINDSIPVAYCDSSQSVDLINEIISVKESMRADVKPDTMLIFDDAMFLFDNKNKPLIKKMFKTRQPRITIVIILQDATGLSTSMRSAINRVVLFGGMAKYKFDLLKNTIPLLNDTEWVEYQKMKPNNKIII